MADSMRIGANLEKIDASKWKKLTAQEIIKEKSKGEEIPSELVAWAEQMAAFSKIPDDVTYEQVDGDVGIEALDKLGLEDTTAIEDENAQAPTETEEPDAVKDPAKTTETEEDEEAVVAQPGQAADTEKTDTEIEEESNTDEELTLADSTLNTDAEKIRKRKERKGLA